jgi:small-conductance mechanosensitive channel
MTSPEPTTTLSESLENNASETSFHTLPEPRNASTSNLSEVGSSSSQQPDAREMSALNDKLINAINLQTSLDDTLQQTKHELVESRKRIAQLEAEARAHEEKLSGGLLVTKEDSDRK